MSRIERQRRPSLPWGAAALGLWLGAAGCGGAPDELLVAYSGDGQAYIEPCG